MPLPAHVICIQNHDQVGNRAIGDRCTRFVPRGGRMLIAALLLLSPATPLIFMGQEFDESSPFLFFTDYGDPGLQKAVSEGRRNEFKDFNFEAHEVPDPQDPQTFERSKLHWPLSEGVNLKGKWYAQLIELRKKFVINAAAYLQGRHRRWHSAHAGPGAKSARQNLCAPAGLSRTAAAWHGLEKSSHRRSRRLRRQRVYESVR